jgi:type VI protein secretion system component VasK
LRKGYYLFSECGALSTKLSVLTILSFVITAVLLALHAPHWTVWYVGLLLPHVQFFILLGLVLIIANICINKICEDVAALMKASLETQQTKQGERV